MKPDALSPWYRDLVVALRVRGPAAARSAMPWPRCSHCADSGDDTPEEALARRSSMPTPFLLAPASGLTLLVNTWLPSTRPARPLPRAGLLRRLA